MGFSLKLADFAGEWRIERDIRGFDGVVLGNFSGVAVFSPTAGAGVSGMVYREKGVLESNGTKMQAERRYLWGEGALAGEIDVCFDDGRPFHRIDLNSSATPEAEHYCDPDTYIVAYDFADWPAWRATWRVTGPRKSYVMQSRYTRKPAD